jgi:alkylation response protein AidB-like acyl-CoA dehydrogenase
MAKSYACAAAVDVAGKAMQLHGGIGYTWESGIHVFLKRAALNRSLSGSPAAHRQRLAARYRAG